VPIDLTATHLLFAGHKLLAAGDLARVTQAYVELFHGSPGGHDAAGALVFEVATGRQLDIDPTVSKRLLSGGDMEPGVPISGAAASGQSSTRGRPKLGVVGREVTLLPRHWAWLETQRGGASAALRRLVDQARAEHADQDRVRDAQDRANRFLTALGGNLPGFEEAMRALYAGDRARFVAETKPWPADVRQWANQLADGALS